MAETSEPVIARNSTGCISECFLCLLVKVLQDPVGSCRRCTILMEYRTCKSLDRLHCRRVLVYKSKLNQIGFKAYFT